MSAQIKKIGLIGGFSWHSTLEYYRLLNIFVGQKIGPDHSAELVLINLDRHKFHSFIQDGQEDKAIQMICEGSVRAQSGGADLLLLCANGLHRFFDQVQAAISIPILHIADAIASEIKSKGMKKVGLLGVRATMEGTFYQDRLKKQGIETIVPNDTDRTTIHDIIYSELEIGKFTDQSRKKYLDIIDRLTSAGAEGIILGCTEIPLLIKQSDTKSSLFSTMDLHCLAAVNAAFKK
jgi:aspartate racemase